MTIITNSEAETIAEGEKLGKTLSPGTVVALFGGLGAGKTVFTKGLALGIGIEDTVSSPTFTIANEYRGKIPLFHFDMYRLVSEDDLFDIGWDNYLEREGICVVEWSEKILSALPSDSILVKIQNKNGNVRSIDIIRKGREFNL